MLELIAAAVADFVVVIDYFVLLVELMLSFAIEALAQPVFSVVQLLVVTDQRCALLALALLAVFVMQALCFADCHLLAVVI